MSLTDHQHTSGLKYFYCTICSKFFKLKIKEKHLEMHKRARPFQCQYCDKKFQTKHDVDRHEMTHTGEKPHKCDECYMSFASLGNLYIHIRNCHPNVQPFKCRFCPEIFSHSFLLMDHIDAEHPGEIIRDFTCDICGKTFRWKHCMKSHMETHAETSAGENCNKRLSKRRRNAAVDPQKCFDANGALKSDHAIPLLDDLPKNYSDGNVWPRVIMSNSLNKCLSNK